MSGVEFEWDEGKRLATLEKHGIDFLDAVEVFEDRPLILRSSHEDEERFIAVGPMDGIMIAVIFTLRGRTIRIVTARRARRNERKRYHAHLAD